MATVNNLIVESKEQWLSLSNDFSADIKFDYIYKRWYYDLYKNDVLVCAGIALKPDCPTLKGISGVYLSIVENNETNAEYEPFSELGGILMLLEVVE